MKRILCILLFVLVMVGCCSCTTEPSTDINYGWSEWDDGWADSTYYFEDILVEDILVEDILVEDIIVETIIN